MFYGKWREPANQQLLLRALDAFRRILDPKDVFAGDDAILFHRNLAFREDPRFRRAMEANAKTRQEHSLALRLNTLTWAADHACRVEGDFVECGVLRGFCSAFICDYLDFAKVPKTFYLYDTFAGIPPEFDTEGHGSPAYAEPGLYEKVVARFAPYPNVRIVKGIVPTSFAQAAPERIAFLHLDLNSSTAEIAALEVLFDRMAPGGLIVFDDLGQVSYRAQQVAEEAFMAARGYRIMELPTGQGLLVKR